MSAPNGFPGQQGWPPKPNGAAPADAYAPRQAQGWPPQPGQAAAPAGQQPAFAPAAPNQQGYATQGRPAQPGASQGQWSPPANGAYAQAPTYAQSAAQSLAEAISQGRGAASQPYAPPAYQPAPAYGTPAADPYSPQFEPYAQAAAQPQRGYAGAPQQAASPYPAQRPGGAYPGYASPPAGYGAGLGASAYAPPQASPAGGYETERPAAAAAYGDDAYRQQTVDDLGFSQAAGGELDPNYGDEEQDYEYEETPRRRRPMMIMAALCGAVVVGGGLAYGYKTIIGDGPGGQPEVIKSAAEPSKFKPADAGGKQFAHSDSKLMGRLGGGSAGAASASTAAGDESDAAGARKVATLVVGRDGSIQAPPSSPVAEPSVDAGVPGVALVDSFGPQSARPAPPAAAPPQPEVVNAAPAPAPQKVVVSPPPAKQPPPQATGSVGDAAEAAPAPTPPPAAKPKKVAAVAPPSDAATASDAAPAPAAAPPVTGGANGYVAVLASVPTSSTSRMDALKRYADMQQKYGATLSGKTPDVAEANLGAKGNYHRLVVGPPASREQANALCAQLKSQGYNDCWITSY